MKDLVKLALLGGVSKLKPVKAVASIPSVKKIKRPKTKGWMEVGKSAVDAMPAPE